MPGPHRYERGIRCRARDCMGLWVLPPRPGDDACVHCNRCILCVNDIERCADASSASSAPGVGYDAVSGSAGLSASEPEHLEPTAPRRRRVRRGAG